MKTVVVYKEQSEHARDVETFMRDFSKQTGKVLETLNPETPEGTHFCEVYDIVEYPTLVALDNNSMVQAMWRGLPLPLISEVSYYT